MDMNASRRQPVQQLRNVVLPLATGIDDDRSHRYQSLNQGGSCCYPIGTRVGRYNNDPTVPAKAAMIRSQRFRNGSRSCTRNDCKCFGDPKPLSLGIIGLNAYRVFSIQNEADLLSQLKFSSGQSGTDRDDVLDRGVKMSIRAGNVLTVMQVELAIVIEIEQDPEVCGRIGIELLHHEIAPMRSWCPGNAVHWITWLVLTNAVEYC